MHEYIKYAQYPRLHIIRLALSLDKHTCDAHPVNIDDAKITVHEDLHVGITAVNYFSRRILFYEAIARLDTHERRFYPAPTGKQDVSAVSGEGSIEMLPGGLRCGIINASWIAPCSSFSQETATIITQPIRKNAVYSRQAG